METKYVCSQDKICNDMICQGHVPNDLILMWGWQIRMDKPFYCHNRSIKSDGVYPVVSEFIDLPKDLFEI